MFRSLDHSDADNASKERTGARATDPIPAFALILLVIWGNSAKDASGLQLTVPLAEKQFRE